MFIFGFLVHIIIVLIGKVRRAVSSGILLMTDEVLSTRIGVQNTGDLATSCAGLTL